MENDVTDLKQLFQKADKVYGDAKEAGNALGKAFVDTLSPIIPDLTFTLGNDEGGIDDITFCSESHSFQNYHPADWNFLEDIIEDFFEPQNFYFDSNVNVSLKEEMEIRKIFADSIGEKNGG